MSCADTPEKDLPIVLIPKADPFFRKAAEELVRLYQQMTGQKLRIVTRHVEKQNMIVLGSDAVNPFVHKMLLAQSIPPLGITSGSDGYRILSVTEENRSLLLIAGGRNRAVLYGIYHFFESNGCSYFWDGDRIPQRENISLSGWDLLEKPRFTYRGLRYFAHRSLKRFQAKHWDWEEWKCEIDYCLKKRFNFFMLRIGYDDLFQKAFPDAVPYPRLHAKGQQHTHSYTDLLPDWSLQYRGKLRKKILSYAFEHDLMHPEDLGTMTHWYTPTPESFLEKEKIQFLPQCVGTNQNIHLVWDIRQKKYLEMYYHLTKTHIQHYGKGDLFHTIGLAERRCFTDLHKNHEMKLFTYRSFLHRFRQDHPHAPLLLASWDFAMHWTAEEIQQLLSEMDPENTLLLEYTAETGNMQHNFTTWGVTGSFPWIFGIFHAYEPNTDIRGDYDLIASRLRLAAEDPFCKGLVFWPETSHSDTLMLEYAAANSWSPVRENYDMDSFITRFVRDRYDREQYKPMLQLWQTFLNVIQMRRFVGPGEKYYFSYQELQFQVLKIFDRPNELLLSLGKSFIEEHKNAVQFLPAIFRLCAKMFTGMQNRFIRRDVMDIARSAMSRTLLYGLFFTAQEFHGFCTCSGSREKIKPLLCCIKNLYQLLADLLESDEDYSLYYSLEGFRKKHLCGEELEYSLKGNADNAYCRSFQFELVKYVYIREFELLSFLIEKRLVEDNREEISAADEILQSKMQCIADDFYNTPLKDFAPDVKEAFAKLSDIFEKTAAETEQMLKLF